MLKQNKKIFAVLFFSIFSTVTGVGIVVPLLPVYAHTLGAGGFFIGMVFGAFSLTRTIFLPYFGRLSDKKGRKPFIVTGLFGYSLISLAFLFSESVVSLITIRLLQGIASAMLMPVIQAYVGDITPRGREGFTMGLFNMSMFFGLSIGPLIGGIINDHFSLNMAFIFMGLLSLIGFFLSLLLLPPTQTEKGINRTTDIIRWKLLLSDIQIAGLSVFRFAYTVCIGIIWGFLPVYADTVFSLSSSVIGTVIMIGVFSSGVIHVPMGYLADRMNKRKLVAVGGIIAALATGVYIYANGFWDLIFVSLLFGLGGGIATPALMSMAVLKGSESEAMGSVMALLTAAHSLGMLTGATLAGLMMDWVQLHYAFPLGAAMMSGAVVVFMFFTRTMENH